MSEIQTKPPIMLKMKRIEEKEDLIKM